MNSDIRVSLTYLQELQPSVTENVPIPKLFHGLLLGGRDVE